MTQAHSNFPNELQDALYAFATDANGPTAQGLDELTRRYPEFAGELTDIAVELALESAESDVEAFAIDEAVSPAISRVMSSFNNRLHEIATLRQRLETKGASPANPFASLSREALTALAARLGATRLFVVKLRDRIIDPATITAGFRSFLAECTQWTLPEINLHLDAEPVAAYGVRYKSDEKPAVQGRQTFEEAVRNSNLTAEQQARLLEL